MPKNNNKKLISEFDIIFEFESSIIDNPRDDCETDGSNETYFKDDPLNDQNFSKGCSINNSCEFGKEYLINNPCEFSEECPINSLREFSGEYLINNPHKFSEASYNIDIKCILELLEIRKVKSLNNRS